MDRTQAHRLWFQTLSLREVGDGPELRALWAEAGLGPDDIRALADAVAIPDDSDRRRAVIRATRLTIRHRGYDPDTLSTPAAGMRGI